MDVYLQQAGFVQGRVEQGEEALGRQLRLERPKETATWTHLMCDVWSGVGDIPSCLGEDTLVVVAVEQGVFGFFTRGGLGR